jgi:hypothetical protein
MQITSLSEVVKRDKDEWKEVGIKILQHYRLDTSIPGIGKCIDAWKKDRGVVEQEMIDGLGFLLGDIIIGIHGGRWVWVKDDFGDIPAIQRVEGGYVTYILDVVSKRLRDDSVAAREIQSIADFYSEMT